MTTVYLFRSTAVRDLYGFTLEESGSNLPGDSGPWTHDRVKSIEVFKDHPRQRPVSEAEILAGIEKHGFHLATARFEDLVSGREGKDA
jgi:hypothetical protein